LLDRLDDAIEEVRWAKDAGLKGVLLPSDHVLKMVNLYYPAYDALWAVCQELDMPLHRHAVKSTESLDVGGVASSWIGSIEVGFYAARAIVHLICSGVFERFPTLKFVTTELPSGAAIPGLLQRLDGMYKGVKDGTSSMLLADEAISNLSRCPSEYFESNCYLGGPLDIIDSYEGGAVNLMFGTDMPHNEGTAPYTKLAFRRIFADLSEQTVQDMLWRTAARVYNFDVDLLQKKAIRIGPTLDEIRAPLPVADWPRYPERSRCQLFSQTPDACWKVGV
jgi:predicted TIM-barrel fold metal-dependent hydrolase